MARIKVPEVDTEFIEPARVKVHEPQRIAASRYGMVATAHFRATEAGLDVTLYLLANLNVRLMPQLRELKPGSRIVSHDFDMRGAKPVQVYSMNEDAASSYEYGYEGYDDWRTHTIYKWVVPWEKE
jgi:hypothetical protein